MTAEENSPDSESVVSTLVDEPAVTSTSQLTPTPSTPDPSTPTNESNVIAKSEKSLPTALRYGLSFLILAAASAACFGLILLAKPSETREATALILKVKLAEVESFAGTIDLVVSGTVVPHQEINVASEVGGKVLKKYPDCLAGNYVKKGTPLIQIDPESYQLEVDTIEAELFQADKRIAEIDQQIAGEEKNLKLAKEDFEIQSREFQRSRSLGSAISPSELDQARRTVNSVQTQVTARTNSIRTLIASRETAVASKALTANRLRRAKLDLRRTKIVAPVDGIIVAENVQQDAFVRQGDQVLRFENTEVAEVRCNLTTTDLDWIRSNSKDKEAVNSIYQLPKTDVSIYDSQEPEVLWDGVLERFSGIGRDPVTKTIPCRIIVPQPIVQAEAGPRALVRGMYVKCRIEVQTSAADMSSDLIIFNERALQPNGDVWFVRDKKLQLSTVDVVDRSEWLNPETGASEFSIVARVTSGDLKSGDTVVISPLSQPSDGRAVEIADDEEELDSSAEDYSQGNSASS